MTETSGEFQEFWLLKRSNTRLHWNLPKSQTFPFVRGVYNGVRATNCRANLIIIPFGQGSPKHDAGGEHIIFQVEGETEFKHDSSSYHLEPWDMLFIPANVPYEYVNIGRGDAIFLSIVGRLAEWPPHDNYYED